MLTTKTVFPKGKREFSEERLRSFYRQGSRANVTRQLIEIGNILQKQASAGLSGDQMIIDPEQFSIESLLPVAMGESEYNAFIVNNVNAIQTGRGLQRFSLESTSFAEVGTLAGQIVFSRIVAQNERAQSRARELVTMENSEFLSEIIPQFGQVNVEDTDTSRKKGERFVEIGMTKNYTFTGEADEQGAIIKLQLRDLIFNRVGGRNMIEEQAKEALKIVQNKMDDKIYDLPAGLVNYYYNTKDVASGIAPFRTGAPSGAAYWQPNQNNNNPLTSLAAVQTAQTLLSAQNDKNSGRSLNVMTDAIFTSMSQGQVANRFLDADLRDTVGGQQAVNDGPRLLKRPDLIVDEQFVNHLQNNGVTTTLANAQNIWLTGDFKRAWRYRRVYEMKSIIMSGENTQAYLDSGVIWQGRVSEFGNAYWDMHGPQYVARNAGAGGF